jgi:hypothetical protein
MVLIRLTNTSPDTTPFGIDVCGVALLPELNVVAWPTTAGAAIELVVAHPIADTDCVATSTATARRPMDEYHRRARLCVPARLVDRKRLRPV